MSLLDQVYAAYEVDNTNFVLTINSLKDSEWLFHSLFLFIYNRKYKRYMIYLYI
jgi:hypothetical protein